MTLAYDGAEALQIFRQGGIDLVALDIMLPKVTGLSILHEIRKTSSTPILMLTALEDEYTQILSFDEQADDYITKFDPETWNAKPSAAPGSTIIRMLDKSTMDLGEVTMNNKPLNYS